MELKNKIQLRYIPGLIFIMVLFTGCQEEYKKISEPDKKVTISPGDTIVELIRRVTLHDGSFDNIIDRCSAISIKFPYTIFINDQLFQINSMGDIETIEQNYYQYSDDIEITFPVTILFSDYSESVLNYEDELEALQEQYNVDLSDDDIECLDFVYPISLCTYNTMFQNANCRKVENDIELFNLFSNLDDLVIELEYPLQVKTPDNFTFTVNDNAELENQINSYINSCDENDIIEFNEDNDTSDTSGDDVSDTLMLTSGNWRITLFADTTDETSSFSSFLFDFKPDFTIQAITGLETIGGIWGFNIYDSVKTIEIEFDTEEAPLEWLNGEWEIILLDTINLKLQTESESEDIKRLNMLNTN